MDELSTNKAQYNNCFVLGSKMWSPEKKRLIKFPMYVDQKGWDKELYGGKDGELCKFYKLSYEEATQTIKGYFSEKSGLAVVQICAPVCILTMRCMAICTSL